MGILQLFSGIYNVQIYNYRSRSLRCYGGKSILIQSATYGSSRYNCYLPIAETTARVKRACSGQYCSLRATDSFFNRNPCPDISRFHYSKMLNVTYTCTMGKFKNRIMEISAGLILASILDYYCISESSVDFVPS